MYSTWLHSFKYWVSCGCLTLNVRSILNEHKMIKIVITNYVINDGIRSDYWINFNCLFCRLGEKLLKNKLHYKKGIQRLECNWGHNIVDSACNDPRDKVQVGSFSFIFAFVFSDSSSVLLRVCKIFLICLACVYKVRCYS